MENLGNGAGLNSGSHWESQPDKEDLETGLAGAFRSAAAEADTVKRGLLVEELYTQAASEGIPLGIINDIYMATRKSLQPPETLDEIRYVEVGDEAHQSWPMPHLDEAQAIRHAHPEKDR